MIWSVLLINNLEYAMATLDLKYIFRCTDSSKMSLEIMESILHDWQQWELNKEKEPR